MKIVLFGASGLTGQQLIEQGLAQGQEITAFVRNASTLTEKKGLKIVVGDVYDANAVAQAISGHGAVLTALGARSLKNESDLLEVASKNIVAGMRKAGVKRLIVLGAAGALKDAGKHQNPGTRWVLWLLKRTLLKHAFRSSAAQEKTVTASGLDFTVALPPQLTNGPHLGNYRVSVDGLPKGGMKISRADLADFMLRQLRDRTYVGQTPYMAY